MNRVLPLLIVTLALACGVRAQTLPSNEIEPDAVPVQNVPDAKPKSAAQPEPLWSSNFSRWFEFQAVNLIVRYRDVENSDHQITANQVQHQEVFRARFKFDAAGHYTINGLLNTGNQFIASWANTGLGTGQAATNLYLKQLYFAAQPVNGVEMQYGGLPIVRGESTEITSYDNDGYLMGERLTLKRPQQLFFDEVDVTFAYLGDVTQPGVNKRFHRLKESNYHQFLVSKKLGVRAVVSADYTFQAGVETLRQAVKINLPKWRLIDSLRFENYERVDEKPYYGFAVTGERKISQRLTVSAGYTRIDSIVGTLNADRFGRGKRLYLLGSYNLTSEITVSTYLTHTLGFNRGVPVRTRYDLLLNYDLLKGLKRVHIL